MQLQDPTNVQSLRAPDRAHSRLLYSLRPVFRRGKNSLFTRFHSPLFAPPEILLMAVSAVCHSDCPDLYLCFTCLRFKSHMQTFFLVQIRRSSVSKSTCSLPVGVPEVFTPRRSQTLDTIRGQTASLAVVLKPDYRCLRANLSRSV